MLFVTGIKNWTLLCFLVIPIAGVLSQKCQVRSKKAKKPVWKQSHFKSNITPITQDFLFLATVSVSTVITLIEGSNSKVRYVPPTFRELNHPTVTKSREKDHKYWTKMWLQKFCFCPPFFTSWNKRSKTSSLHTEGSWILDTNLTKILVGEFFSFAKIIFGLVTIWGLSRGCPMTDLRSDLKIEESGCGGLELVWLHMLRSCEASWMYYEILRNNLSDGVW